MLPKKVPRLNPPVHGVAHAFLQRWNVMRAAESKVVRTPVLAEFLRPGTARRMLRCKFENG